MSITADRWYRSETIPDSLRELARRLVEHYELTPTAAGIKGDPYHRGGYHRSRAFLLRSSYSRSASYSVTDHPGNAEGDPSWCCALDLTLPRPELLAACQRLDVAVRAGRLDKIAEWYGNSDGDQRVDGYDNIRSLIATSDSSHLWHLHIGFIRAHAGDDHADVFAILTGEEETMTPKDFVELLSDPSVKTALGNAIKETRFGFDASPDGKGWTIGGALQMLLTAPPPRPAPGTPTSPAGPPLDTAAVVDALWKRFTAALAGK